ncbi:hypothetical protein [Nocardioides zeae]|uniref:Anti-anti-sigma regulatory factor n=1 Tax=Nocardioides zeae TaxID=1457234 RepID=A0AAJ1U1U4_9ACTN|nr:hypothetical protein [Nocardioides zeae]MDQ1103923.1 anti-anti-sigma regulatory factor [Nocardioides zeae]
MPTLVPSERPRRRTHFSVDIDVIDGVVTLTGVLDDVTVRGLDDAVLVAARATGAEGPRDVVVDLRGADLLSAAATRLLEASVVTAAAQGIAVRFDAPAGCMAHRVLVAVRALLGDRAERLPLVTRTVRHLHVVPQPARGAELAGTGADTL